MGKKYSQYACTTYQHELCEGVRGPGAAVRPLVVVSSSVSHVLHQATSSGLITVQTDEHPADSTDPVIVEESRLADITHLPHTSHWSLPGDGLVSTHVNGQTLPLLLDHLTELVTDQTEDIFGFGDVTVGRRILLVWSPQ